MKNFDDARAERALLDRSFQIGGETFVRKTGVRPEILMEWADLSRTSPSATVLGIVDQTVLGMIELDGDAEDRWAALRAREEDPLTLGDLVSLVEWLIEEQTAQTPTQPASPSSAGRARTRRASTDASSSQDEPPESEI